LNSRLFTGDRASASSTRTANFSNTRGTANITVGRWLARSSASCDTERA
jgi:hypothetical protein